MPDLVKTTLKLPVKPFTGEEGNTFSADNQPDPDLKKAGWEEWRRRRVFSQGVIKHAQKADNLTKYTEAIWKLAMKGNPKAIDVINKCLEDDIIKLDFTGENIIRIIRNPSI